MINERLTTLDTIKSLHQQERRVNWNYAFQNLALVAVMVIGGSWFVCNAGSTCWAASTAGDKPATAATQVVATQSSEEAKVEWLKDHDEAIARAKKLGRPVLIDFAASWCVPCVMMDKHVWPDEAVQEALDSKVIPLRIDMDGKSAPRLVKKYRVEFVPTILLIDVDGKELAREGFVDAQQLIEMIKIATKTSIGQQE